MNLQLPLKKEWFYLTKSGEKKEEYREITPYWCNRLAMLNGEKMTKKQWRRYLITSGVEYMRLCSKPNSPINPITFPVFENNIMTLGYPSSINKDRFVTLKHKGIKIRMGNPKLGAKPDKLYFVISHGDLV